MKLSVSSFALAAVMGMLGYTAASAAEVASSNPFNGFYAGVNAGYIWGNSKDQRIESGADNYWYGYDDGSFVNDIDGYLIGGQAGANFVSETGLMFGAEVVGAVGSVSATNSNWVDEDGCLCDAYYDEVTDTMNTLGLAQAKLGFASEDLAFYVSGGLALGKFSTDMVVGGDGFDGDWSSRSGFDSVETGWTVGGGIDAMITENTSVGIAYNYIDYGQMSVDTLGTLTSEGGGVELSYFTRDVHPTANVVRLTVNYNF